jgi:hypothetical protein
MSTTKSTRLSSDSSNERERDDPQPPPQKKMMVALSMKKGTERIANGASLKNAGKINIPNSSVMKDVDT